jgi:adenylyltransferase/sulfurtransferase
VPLGRLTVYDALHSAFRTLKLNRDPACRLCGESPDLHSVSNQETTAAPTCTPNTMESITTTELRALLATGFSGLLIDVREPAEHAIANIPQARLIPLATVPDQLDSLPRDREILIHCKAGGRSARAVQFLLDQGFTQVKNVGGGMDAWLAEE